MLALPPKHSQSKTTFLFGCQCPKRLWLNKFEPKLRSAPDSVTQAKWQRGTQVGQLAQQLFPGGEDFSPKHPSQYRQAVVRTAEGLAQGKTVLYEATFQHEGVLVMLDILVQVDGRWLGFEVKSSTRVKPVQVMDLALQYWVINGAGLALDAVHILHLNSQYRRGEQLDIEQLFHRADLTSEVIALQPYIQKQVLQNQQTLEQTQVPEIPTGDHCWAPYPCDFAAHCQAIEPTAPQPPEWMETYPAGALHLATVRPAIPMFQGDWPFRHLPYCFSLLRIDEKNSPARPQSYLAPEWPIATRPLVEALLQATETLAVVLYAEDSPVQNLLNEWRESNPDLANRITQLASKLMPTNQAITDDHPQLMETEYGQWLREKIPEQKRLLEKQVRKHGTDWARKILRQFLP